MKNFLLRLLTGFLLWAVFLFSVFCDRTLYLVFFAFCIAWAAVFEWPFLTRMWPRWVRYGVGFLYFCAPLLVVEHLYLAYSHDNFLPIIYPVLAATICDSAAYFVGKFFGNHYAFPKISPKKTYEGLVAAYVSVLLFHFGLSFYLVRVAGYLQLIVDYPVFTALLVASVAVLGDLSISVLKRRSGIKDSGRLFPGHGGVLDRAGSLILVLLLVGVFMGVAR